MTQKTTTLRDTARELVIKQVSAAARKEHERNYEKLHIYRDGSVSWFECINKTDDLIDSEASHFAAVPSVITVGTGSCGCNCDYCNEVYDAEVEENALADDEDAKYESVSDAIDDAVLNSDTEDMEASMLVRFDEIETGYFDDEQEA